MEFLNFRAESCLFLFVRLAGVFRDWVIVCMMLLRGLNFIWFMRLNTSNWFCWFMVGCMFGVLIGVLGLSWIVSCCLLWVWICLCVVICVFVWDLRCWCFGIADFGLFVINFLWFDFNVFCFSFLLVVLEALCWFDWFWFVFDFNCLYLGLIWLVFICFDLMFWICLLNWLLCLNCFGMFEWDDF